MGASTPSWINDVKFRVFFNQGTSEIQVLDLTYGGYGVDESLVVGMLKIVSPDGSIYQNVGWADDDYSNPDIYNGTIIPFKSDLEAIDIVDNFTLGTYTFYYKISIDGGVAGFQVSKSYTYNVSPPSTEVFDTFNRETSELSFQDLSDYKLFIMSGNSSSYAYPTSTNRLLTIRSPLNVDALTTVTSPSAIVTIGPNCYTGNYDVMLETEVTYELANWGNYNWINISFSVENIPDGGVNLSSGITCFTNYSNCITAVNERYISFIGTNPSKADAYKIIRDNITFYYALSLIYREAGEDTTYCCTKLQELLRQFDFCTSESPTTPQEIIPTSTSGTGADGQDGSKWYNGDSIPDNSFGDNGDYYLVTTDSKVYNKIAGLWQLIMTISGGSAARDSIEITDDYAVTDSDDFILVNSSYRTVDVQLPAANTLSEDTEFSIKSKKLVNTTRILAGVDESIEGDGVKNYTIGTEGDTIDVRIVGTNWEIK